MKRRQFLTGAASSAFIQQARGESLIGPAAISGDRFTHDGREYHLSDILAPSMFRLSGPNAEQHFDQSTDTLRNLIAGNEITIEKSGENSRWGARIVIAKLVGDEQTLQEHLIREGAARVAPQTEDYGFIDRLLDLEELARNSSAGLWRLRSYRVRSARSARDLIGHYGIVEGEITRAQLAGNRFYMNFGDDFRTDFTATISSGAYRRWRRIQPEFAEELKGHSVRVRGFLQEINGPSIEITHPRQLEWI